MVEQSVDIVELNVNNPDHIRLLEYFKQAAGASLTSFRYFNSRSFEVLKNHMVTLLYVQHDEPIAYGHLDKEEDKVWLGIAVVEKRIGTGLGTRMMHDLMNRAHQLLCKEIFLSVDKQNPNAINLYQKFGFRNVKDLSSSVQLMQVALTNK